MYQRKEGESLCLTENVMELILDYADLSHNPTTWGELADACAVYQTRVIADEEQRDVVPTGHVFCPVRDLKEYINCGSGEFIAMMPMLLRASCHTLMLDVWREYTQFYPVIVSFEEEEDVLVEQPALNAGESFDAWITPRFDHFTGLVVSNPYLSHYSVKTIGSLEEKDTGLNTSSAYVTKRRRFSLELKAALFLLMLQGRLALCQAAETDSNKYRALVQVFVDWFGLLFLKVLGVMGDLVGRFNLAWYHALAPEWQAAFDILAAVIIAGTLHRLASPRERKLAEPKEKKGRDCFLGQLATENGIVYKVMINDKIYNLTSQDAVAGKRYEEEMAMPGSEYFPCKEKPIGAIMVSNIENDLCVFGVFWRLDNFLITARHCADVLNQSTADIYLAKTKVTKHRNHEVDTTKVWPVPEDFFDSTENLVGALHVDAYARLLTDAQWAQIGVSKAVIKLPSLYEQQVQTVGFTGNGLLVSANGKTLKGSGLEMLHHTASTQKGFSGGPIFCGTSVVGMHVATEGTHNVAIRRELICYLIEVSAGEESRKKHVKYTYADAAYKEYYRQMKQRGGVFNVERYGRGDKFALELDNGECTFGWSFQQMCDTFGPYESREKNADYIEDLLYHNSSFGRGVNFRDENADIAVCDSVPWTVTEGERPVHAPQKPKQQPDVVRVFETLKDEAIKCGYVEGLYGYPEMDRATENESLKQHLLLFSAGLKNLKNVPSDQEIGRCALMVAEQCKLATFSPDPEYKTLPGVLKIINSSIINPKKSSGFPYVAEGMPTNAQVLKHYGEKGFAQLVLNEWDLDFFFKWFLKGEPNKLKKLTLGRPRGLAGMPVHKLVKHASVFSNMATAFVENWRDMPVKYGYSPGNPGDIANLKKTLPGKVWSSDKEVWDFNAKEWHFKVFIRVVQLLAVCPEGMDAADFDHYVNVEIPNTIGEIYKDCKYRCSDGSVYKMEANGIMKSGWFLTIVGNSVMQLVHNNMILMKLGYDDDYILSKRIVVGGDDVEQEPACDDIETYIAMSKDLGIVMEIEEREGLEFSEYFSADLRYDDQKRWRFLPQRFGKHVEHMLTVKKENLASALSNYMGDHRHDEDKYNFFLKMFHKLRKGNPGLFPLSFVKSRQALLSAQYGY
jgi:hypothetical protein